MDSSPLRPPMVPRTVECSNEYNTMQLSARKLNQHQRMKRVMTSSFDTADSTQSHQLQSTSTIENDDDHMFGLVETEQFLHRRDKQAAAATAASKVALTKRLVAMEQAKTKRHAQDRQLLKQVVATFERNKEQSFQQTRSDMKHRVQRMERQEKEQAAAVRAKMDRLLAKQEATVRVKALQKNSNTRSTRKQEPALSSASLTRIVGKPMGATTTMAAF